MSFGSCREDVIQFSGEADRRVLRCRCGCGGDLNRNELPREAIPATDKKYKKVVGILILIFQNSKFQKRIIFEQQSE